ncbi:hypothetical protein V2J09_019944 [Rumex salicifolius]
MASVKVALLDQMPCNLRPRKARTKFLSRFRLSIVAVSVILLFLILFCSNYPSKNTYFLRPSLKAIKSDSPFTVISAFSSSVISNVTTESSENATKKGSDGIQGFEEHTHFTNHSLSLEMKNGDKETLIQGQSLVENTTRSSENVQRLAFNGSEAVERKIHLGNLELEKRNSSDRGEILVSSSSFHGGEGAVIVGNLSTEKGKVGNFSDMGNFPLSYYGTQLAERSSSSSDLSRSCDIFDGKWVKNDAKPYYPPGSCPYVDRDFNCFSNGRPDDDFVKWKWKPHGCQLPRLNATDFLERLRGKKLVFVGDSLNRNMWESLVCILRHKVQNKKKVYEISGRTEFKKKGFYAFRFEASSLISSFLWFKTCKNALACAQEYNCSIDFVGSPFLVRESAHRGRNGTFETLRLDLIDRTSPMYQDADILVFNTGHWWTHEKTSRGGGQWNSGGQCHKETEPIFNETYLGKYPSKMRALELVMQGMKMPIIYLNISKMTAYRKDGHPSIYRKTYATQQERVAAELYQDCSHWCLPGVPDTWNELLYASLIEAQSRAPRKV